MFFIYILVLVVWDILTASILTIPLYKIMCNISIQENIGDIPKEWILPSIFNWIYILNTSSIDINSICINGNVVVDACLDSICTIDVICNNVLVVDDISKMSSINETNICITCISRVSNYSPLEFITLQDNIYVFPGEPNLIFFRLYNPTRLELTSISIYFVYPSNAAAYVNKVQCFCFDQITVKSFETMELPVLFQIESSGLLDSWFEYRWYLSYVLFVQR